MEAHIAESKWNGTLNALKPGKTNESMESAALSL